MIADPTWIKPGGPPPQLYDGLIADGCDLEPATGRLAESMADLILSETNYRCLPASLQVEMDNQRFSALGKDEPFWHISKSRVEKLGIELHNVGTMEAWMLMRRLSGSIPPKCLLLTYTMLLMRQRLGRRVTLADLLTQWHGKVPTDAAMRRVFVHQMNGKGHGGFGINAPGLWQGIVDGIRKSPPRALEDIVEHPYP